MFERVKLIIEENIDCEGMEIVPETELLTDLSINSLDLVELVCAFEVSFDIVVPEKDMRKLLKVQDILDYIKKVG